MDKGVRKKERSHIQSAEIKFMTYLRRFTKADKLRNETLRSDLNISSMNDNIKNGNIVSKEW